MKSYILILILLVSVVACGKKQHEISKDNITATLPIESVAVSDNSQISQGNMSFVEGDFGTAIEHYQQAMQQNKAVAFYNIGVCYYLLGNIQQAELNFREAVTADPSFEQAIMNLVAVLAQQEKIDEAEKFLTRIIYTNKSPRVYVDMANISLKKNDPARAAFYYKKALDTDSKSPYILSNYANFLISIGEYRDGIGILESIEDKDFPMNYNIAYAYYKLGEDSSSFIYADEAFYSQGETMEGYSKLAFLFGDLGRYQEESKTLIKLIRMNPMREYKIRLVTSYINAATFDKALDELNALLAEYPKDITLNMLNYEVLVMAGKVAEAGNFIRSAYKTLGGDTVLYYYTKHLSLFERNNNEVRGLIFVNRENSWLNLARTVYNLKNGDYKAAASYLARVPESAGNDYFSYKAFLAITAKQFREAEQYVSKMDKMNPDSSWYGLVIAWNLKQPNTLLKIANDFRNNPVTSPRTPFFRYDLVPVLADMSYTYRFDDKGVDAVAMLAYPIFIEPDEVVQFLIMGRSTLKEAERDSATKKLEGMKRNNEGIDAFYAFDFEQALAKFLEAGRLLANNSIVSYNIGLTYFNIGDNERALAAFERAIIQDKNNAFAYLGTGLVNYRRGNTELMNTSFESARKISVELLDTTTPQPLNSIRVYYLSVLASERFGKRDEARKVAESTDALVVALDILMEYFEKYDAPTLSRLGDSPVFRVNLVKDLLAMRHTAVDIFTEPASRDKYYTLAKKYIMLERGGGAVTTLNDRFAKDRVYLKDMVYASVFQRDKAAGLRYLQMLSRLDYRYIELYKVSLYYFTWVRDFVNAEASYGSLDRAGYEDKITSFYMLLYFLINYNETRLNTYLNLYHEKYKDDYRSGVVTALMNLNTKNINGFYSIMNRLIAADPYLFDKMFIEVNFAKF